MTEKITVDRTVIDNLVEKANLEPTGNSNECNITNPVWVDGYKEGMLQAVNAVMGPIYLADTPPFAVGEYYVTNGLTFKVIAGDQKDRIQTLFLINGALVKSSRSLKGDTFKNSTPATAEQIATFKRAEQFATKGRKLDEFRVGDLVKSRNISCTVTKIAPESCVYIRGFFKGGWRNYFVETSRCDLIQTAEELQEVGGNE